MNYVAQNSNHEIFQEIQLEKKNLVKACCAMTVMPCVIVRFQSIQYP